jgi:hypothetical protein
MKKLLVCLFTIILFANIILFPNIESESYSTNPFSKEDYCSQLPHKVSEVVLKLMYKKKAINVANKIIGDIKNKISIYSFYVLLDDIDKNTIDIYVNNKTDEIMAKAKTVNSYLGSHVFVILT